MCQDSPFPRQLCHQALPPTFQKTSTPYPFQVPSCYVQLCGGQGGGGRGQGPESGSSQQVGASHTSGNNRVTQGRHTGNIWRGINGKGAWLRQFIFLSATLTQHCWAHLVSPQYGERNEGRSTQLLFKKCVISAVSSVEIPAQGHYPPLSGPLPPFSPNTPLPLSLSPRPYFCLSLLLPFFSCFYFFLILWLSLSL